MIETRIPIAPDTSTTLTNETTEHIVNRKVTIKIDRDYLKKKYAELYEQLAKVAEKYPYTPKKQLVKKQGHAHVKNRVDYTTNHWKITNKHCLLSEVKSTF